MMAHSVKACLVSKMPGHPLHYSFFRISKPYFYRRVTSFGQAKNKKYIRSLSSITSREYPKFSVMGGSYPMNEFAVDRASTNRIELNDCKSPPFTKILVANRGEIAVRIMRTAQSLGIKTVAIHSTVDYRSPHATMADEKVCVGPAPSSDSYLNIDNIIQAINNTGAQAVHPGYGFLSENSEFARRVEEETNAIFLGPPHEAITAMGDKITSKKIASSAGVNVIPGFEGIIDSADKAVRVANEIGFPVMIKATSGGGGKGMRICYTDQELREGFQLSTAEARNFFGDDRVFVEKFIERPHHIEFQVLSGTNPHTGDLDILVFPERECSIQRRNQKIIEESPSTMLTPETRREMARQVRSLVRKVGYTSAGTVEFLVDENQFFFFLEMNTRLQVEHPVTEMISTGPIMEKGLQIDLVRGMLNVGAGRGIPPEYLEILNKYDDGSGDDTEGKVMPHSGHAIEARIYAENPLRGFLPSNGPLLEYIEPPTHFLANGPHIMEQSDESKNHLHSPCSIRVDSGVTAGSNITTFYDPILSKLVAYSPNSRSESIIALSDALDRYVIRGVGHNIPFISDVLRHSEFISGNTPTDFISNHYPDGFSGVKLIDSEVGELAAIVAAVGISRSNILCQPSLPLSNIDVDEVPKVIVCCNGMFGDAFAVSFVDKKNGYFAVERLRSKNDNGNFEEGKNVLQKIELKQFKFDPSNILVELVVNGLSKVLQIEGEDKTGQFHVRMHGSEYDVVLMSPQEYELSKHMKEPKLEDTSNFILSPMPGTLISYAVKSGDYVEDGQEICIVEAMKMQNVLRSTRSGIIKECKAEVGASLQADEVIVEFVFENDAQKED